MCIGAHTLVTVNCDKLNITLKIIIQINNKIINNIQVLDKTDKYKIMIH